MILIYKYNCLRVLQLYISLQDEYSLITNSKFRLVYVSEWMLVLS